MKMNAVCLSVLVSLGACAGIRPYTGKGDRPRLEEHIADFSSPSASNPFIRSGPRAMKTVYVQNPADNAVSVVVVCKDGPTTLEVPAHAQRALLAEVPRLEVWESACAIHRWDDL